MRYFRFFLDEMGTIKFHGVFSNFWGKMGAIEFYGAFFNFLGQNRCNQVLWGILEVFRVKWVQSSCMGYL